jgi:hypothetical protein
VQAPARFVESLAGGYAFDRWSRSGRPACARGTAAYFDNRSKARKLKGGVMNADIGNFFAPFTLIVGSALLAIGLLSLLDLHFFKTRLQSKAALALGLAFILVTEAMFVTSSAGGRYFYGQKEDVTDCEFEIEQAYPLERGKDSLLIDDNIKQCMDRLGYDWTIEHPHCREARLATNSFCYLPKSVFDRTIVAFQMKFE